MRDSRLPDDGLRRRVVAIFFAGLLGLAVAAGALDWVCDRAGGWLAFDRGWLNRAPGLALSLAGLALVAWSVRVQYVRGGGTPAPMVPTRQLVTAGPYAWTRNPMTLGALGLYLGIGLALGSGGVLALTLMVFSLLLTYIYVHEARELAGRFGSDYLDYKKRTPFLLPRFRSGLRTQGDGHRRTRLHTIAALLAFTIGAMAIVAGGQVLLGRVPDYYVIDWLPVYNLAAGILTSLVTAVLIWTGHRLAWPAALATLGAHAVVLLILLTRYRETVAVDSLVAMVIRLAVWSAILALLFYGRRRVTAIAL